MENDPGRDESAVNARRALLYIPGDDARKIAKATTLDVDCICLDMDCICLDMEDGVALNQELEARQSIARALVEQDFGRAERILGRSRAAGKI